MYRTSGRASSGRVKISRIELQPPTRAEMFGYRWYLNVKSIHQRVSLRETLYFVQKTHNENIFVHLYTYVRVLILILF